MMLGGGDNETLGRMRMISGLPLQLNPAAISVEVAASSGGGGGGAQKREERVPQWSHQETRDFIAIRAELERDFTITKRNKMLWEIVATKMNERGYRRTPDQCKCKWKNLVNRYKDGAGLGTVCRDHNGKVDLLFSSKIDTPSEGSILRYELKAAFLALSKVEENENVWLEMDSKVCVDIINDNCSCPWTEVILKTKIQQCLARYATWKVIHIWREANRAADFLSKISPLNNRALDPRDVPFDLRCIFAHDKDGRIYQR